MKRRSTVFQRELVKPTKINNVLFKKSFDRSEYGKAMKLVLKEMKNLVEWDVTNHPSDDIDTSITPEMIEEAKKLIDDEIVEKPEYDSEMASAMDLCFNELIQHDGKLTRIGNLNRKDQIDCMVRELDVSPFHFYSNF